MSARPARVLPSPRLDDVAELRAEVTREAPDRLSGQTWRFSVPVSFGTDLALRLDHYSAWTRLSTRHRAVVTDGRRFNHTEGRWTPGWRNDCERSRLWAPPLPDDVIAEAREAILATIRALPVNAPTLEDAQAFAKQRRWL